MCIRDRPYTFVLLHYTHTHTHTHTHLYISDVLQKLSALANCLTFLLCNQFPCLFFYPYPPPSLYSSPSCHLPPQSSIITDKTNNYDLLKKSLSSKIVKQLCYDLMHMLISKVTSILSMTNLLKCCKNE